MRDFRDAKAMAQTLREALKAKSVSLTHSESLELVARTLGFPDWNHLAARIQSSQPPLAPSGATTAVTVPSGAALPIVPMRDIVMFPQMVAPLFVGREKSRLAIERALATDYRLLLVTQRRAADDDPAVEALHRMGVTASLINCTLLTDGTLKLVVSGLERTTVVRSVETGDFLTAEIAPIEESRGQTAEAAVLSRAVFEAFKDFRARKMLAFYLPDIDAPGLLADGVAPLLPVSIEQRQRLLETSDVVARLEAILELMKDDQQAT